MDTDKLLQDLQRLGLYYPYRICWGAIHLQTGERVTFADTTKRRMNQYIKKGWTVFRLTPQG